MEQESSFLYSHVPATCPYPEIAQSSPCPHFLTIHLNIILPSIPEPSKWSLFLRFPTETLYAPLLSAISVTYHAHYILLDLIARITFGEEYRSISCSLCSFLHSSIITVKSLPIFRQDIRVMF